MAKGQGSVRMGPISLFTLVIVLCLAVMAVLTVTTAEASRALMNRQAAATAEIYIDEVAAQAFVASLDSSLLEYREAHADAAGAADAGAASGTADAIDATELKNTLTGALPTCVSAAETAAKAQGSFVNVDARTVEGEDVAQVAGVFGAADVGPDALGLAIDFETEHGRLLSVVLQVHKDGTYSILSWKTTTKWSDEGTGDTLWSGV